MASVAQLVRAPGCGSGGREFNSPRPPQKDYMKYHYQEGIVEKDRRGHPKLWLGFFVFVIFVVYGGFLATTLFLNGWPLSPIDQTATAVKTSRPSSSDKLYIPALNLTANLDGNSIEKSGNPADSAVTLRGQKLAAGLTPAHIRSVSPFFNLADLREGDEIFLDSSGKRYVYKIAKSDQTKRRLTLQTDGVKLTATPIGTVIWDGKQPKIETL